MLPSEILPTLDDGGSPLLLFTLSVLGSMTLHQRYYLRSSLCICTHKSRRALVVTPLHACNCDTYDFLRLGFFAC